MSEQEEAIALCWHCDRSPRAEGQILCNDCLEEAAAELVAVIPAQLDRLNALTRERDELRAILDDAMEFVDATVQGDTLGGEGWMNQAKSVLARYDTLTNKAAGGKEA
jgi:hypothetical protein